IGDTADGDGLRLPSRRHQLFAEQFRRVFLHENSGLEIEAGREPEILVIWTCEAVNASVFASAVGIDARIEADVRAVVVGNDGSRDVFQEDGVARGILRRIPFRYGIRGLFESIA